MRAHTTARALGPWLGLLLLVAPAASSPLPQELAADSPGAAEAPGRQVQDPRLWAMMDEIVAVVGDEAITMQDLRSQFQNQELRKRLDETRSLPPEEAAQAQGVIEMEALADLTESLLRIRAGEDRGFDPKLVASLVNRQVERRREATGGPVQFRRWMDTYRLTPESYRQLIERNLYQEAWEGSTTGRQAGPTGRPDRDTYVRPGLLYATYRDLAGSQRAEERAVVGAIEGKVELSEIALSIEANGGRQKTFQLAESLRKKVRDGEEQFDDLASTFSEMRRPERITVTLQRVQQTSQGNFGHGRLAAFAENASAGEISPPFESRLGGVHLFQLVQRIDASEAEPFLDIEVQRRVENWITRQRERVRLGRGTEDLLRSVQIQPINLARFLARPAWIYRTNNGG